MKIKLDFDDIVNIFQDYKKIFSTSDNEDVTFKIEHLFTKKTSSDYNVDVMLSQINESGTFNILTAFPVKIATMDFNYDSPDKDSNDEDEIEIEYSFKFPHYFKVTYPSMQTIDDMQNFYFGFLESAYEIFLEEEDEQFT